MFFVIEAANITSYADGNTPYVSAYNIDVIMSLEEASKILFKWFNDNLMKIDTEKCYLLVSTNNIVKKRKWNFDITNSKSEKQLGVKFNHKLSFDYHVLELCKKVNSKIQTLSRAASYLSISKGRILNNAFSKSQFSYYPLV